MKGLWSATLNPSSPRYHEWHAILGGNDVPLLSPRESEAQLGAETDQVYLLNVPALSEQQLNRLINHLAKKFGAACDATLDEIRSEVKSKGMPIRYADVIVAFSMRAFV
jgi:hypothetical protein